MADWLNYHHLLYFHTVAHEGSVTRAARKLSLAQPTISAQLRTLEASLGTKLLVKRGRGLALTENGRLVLGYADEIFALGRELQNAIRRESVDRALRLDVGVTDAVPKLVARELLRPTMQGEAAAHVVVREGKLDALVAELAMHRLDVVISDHRYTAPSSIRIHHHRLGECGVTFFAAPELAARLVDGFPNSLDGAPALLPAETTALRGAMESWFAARKIRPVVHGEFEDTALLKVFGSEGDGFLALPSVAVDEIVRSHGVEVIGHAPDCRESFFALTAQRKLEHPSVAALTRAAREELFSAG